MCPNCEAWALLGSYEERNQAYADCPNPKCGMQFDIHTDESRDRVDMISREEAEKHIEYLRENSLKSGTDSNLEDEQ